MANQNINEVHVYETSLLGWVVQYHINGGTDWYTPAAFQYENDAEEYRDFLANRSPDGNYTVAWVGTLHRA